MNLLEHCIIPNWPAPKNVRALQATRNGGFSATPYNSLNLGDHVGDAPLTVERNRMLLQPLLPSEPVWLKQVHGTVVVDAGHAACYPQADAVHAGWRGLCDGVIEQTVRAMSISPQALMAWLGPAIGPQAFEVGEEVRVEFVAQQPEAAAAFAPGISGKWYADIYQLARLRLHALGITGIYGGGLCTHTDHKRFFSYRRDGATGRMGTFIWIAG